MAGEDSTFPRIVQPEGGTAWSFTVSPPSNPNITTTAPARKAECGSLTRGQGYTIMSDNWNFGRVRKWLAGLSTAALAVLAAAVFFGFAGLAGGSPFMFLIGAGIAGGWWFFEYRYNQPDV